MRKILFLLSGLLMISGVFAQNTLVVYYSYTNNVRSIVNELSNHLDVDIVEILPAEEGLRYEADNYAIGSALISAIRDNPDDAESYPAIKPVDIDFSRYDNVVIATPLWWSNMAAPMQSFLFQNGDEMGGKNISLIVSSASSGISSVVEDAKRLIPDGNFNNTSLWINNGNRASMPNLLNEWVVQSGLQNNSSTSVPQIENDGQFDGEMYDMYGRKIDFCVKGQIYIQNGEKWMKTDK